MLRTEDEIRDSAKKYLALMRKQGIAGIRIREPRFLKFFYEIHAKNSVNSLFFEF